MDILSKCKLEHLGKWWNWTAVLKPHRGQPSSLLCFLRPRGNNVTKMVVHVRLVTPLNVPQPLYPMIWILPDRHVQTVPSCSIHSPAFKSLLTHAKYIHACITIIKKNINLSHNMCKEKAKPKSLGYHPNHMSLKSAVHLNFSLLRINKGKI